MGNYVNADELPSTFNSLKVQHRSDVVRVAVLLRYGGIYLDVSTVCMKGFDDIFEKPEGGPNLLITAPVYGTFKADPTLAWPNNAFLVAREPGDLVLAEWHQRMLKYLEAPCARSHKTHTKTHPRARAHVRTCPLPYVRTSTHPNPNIRPQS